jgi:hypothetical protein
LPSVWLSYLLCFSFVGKKKKKNQPEENRDEAAAGSPFSRQFQPASSSCCVFRIMASAATYELSEAVRKVFIDLVGIVHIFMCIAVILFKFCKNM